MAESTRRPALASNLVNTLFIAPRAQTDIFNLDYQLYLFELLHQALPNRLSHLIGITFSPLAYYALGMNLGRLDLLFLILFAGMHLGMLLRNRLARLVPVVLALHGLLWLIAYFVLRHVMTPSAPWYFNPIFHILFWPTVQTITHALEAKVPPPWGGEKLWAVTRDLFRSSPRVWVVSALLFPMYVFLELISTPRLFFVIILRTGRALKLTPGWLGDLDARIDQHIQEAHPALALEDFNAVFKS
jgi:hypothetical protein